jgi:hypothetical protein
LPTVCIAAITYGIGVFGKIILGYVVSQGWHGLSYTYSYVLLLFTSVAAWKFAVWRRAEGQSENRERAAYRPQQRLRRGPR